MDIEKIKEKVRDLEYVYSLHADIERRSDELTFHQIENALLEGEILEQYPDTGRGESCLVLGFFDDIPIHIVCGWRGPQIVIVTVYVPKPPKFIDPWKRGKTDE
jgi:hypothetical protein